jgi:magnesium-transporting ATPase (P-type)
MPTPQFVVVVYGRYDGQLGLNCNHSSNEICNIVFRGRSTTFATLIFCILIFAFELKHFDRSMFSLTPGRFFVKYLLENRTLFLAVVGGMISVVLPIYIPVFNRRVFYQGPISWEWGLVIGLSLLFVVWCELWKLMRPTFYKRWEQRPVNRSAFGLEQFNTEAKSALPSPTVSLVNEKYEGKKGELKEAEEKVKHTEAE